MMTQPKSGNRTVAPARPDIREDDPNAPADPRKKKADDKLEAALEDSFPASDPPGLTPGPHKKSLRKKK